MLCVFYHNKKNLKNQTGNSLAVQWLGLRTRIAKGPGSIPGRGTKIPQAMQSGQKKKIKQPIRGTPSQNGHRPQDWSMPLLDLGVLNWTPRGVPGKEPGQQGGGHSEGLGSSYLTSGMEVYQCFSSRYSRARTYQLNVGLAWGKFPGQTRQIPWRLHCTPLVST